MKRVMPLSSSSRGEAVRTLAHVSHRGFTIVELMVAMTLALLVTAAVGALYVSSKSTFRVQDNASAMDETIRAIEEDMTREFRKAGYFGCYRWKKSSPAYLNTARLDTAQNGTYTIPKNGSEVKLGPTYDVRGGAATATAVAPLQSAVTIKPGTEYVSVSYGQPIAYLATSMTDGKAPLQLNKAVAVRNGQPLLVSNCDAMTLLRADQTGNLSSIAHDPLAGDNVDMGDPIFGYTVFGQGSMVMAFQSAVYFIGERTGAPASLYLLSPDNTTEPAQPLAANVEQLNVLYGIDTGGSALTFAAAAGVTDWAAVRAVRVGIVVQSNDDNVSGASAGAGVNFTWDAANGRYNTAFSATDKRIRKSHVFTVALRGRAPAI